MRATQILLLITFACLWSANLAADEPPTPRIPPGVLIMLADHEARLDALEGKIGVKTACPCPEGLCICGDDCKCENCPEHGKKAPSVRVLFFTADWCGPCQAAKKRLGDLVDQLEIVDCTDSNPMSEYASVRYPTCVLLDENGKEIKRCVGEYVKPSIVGDWLNPPESKPPVKGSVPDWWIEKDSRITPPTTRAHHDDGDASDDQIRTHLVDAHGYSWSQVQGMSRSQLKAAHDAGHGGEKTTVSLDYPVKRPAIRYSQPAQYRPTTYYQPSFSGCANCRR